jgi:hypothetical protein
MGDVLVVENTIVGDHDKLGVSHILGIIVQNAVLPGTHGLNPERG